MYPEQHFLGVMRWLREWESCKTQGDHACSSVLEKQRCVSPVVGRGMQQVWELPALQVGSIPACQCGGPLQNDVLFTIKCISIAVPALALDSACCLQDK